MRNPKYKQPNMGHYIRYDEEGGLHLFFDDKKKAEFDKKRTQKYMEKIQEKLKEMTK